MQNLRESQHIAKDMLKIKWDKIQNPTTKKDYPKKAEFPTLTQFALDVVAANFEKYPHLSGISEQVREKIIAKTNKGLDIKFTSLHIHEESYWKDACQKRWKLNNLQAHGCSWKQTYLEKTIEELIKNMTAPEEVATLLMNLRAAKHYVFNLRIPGMKYVADFKLIMDNLPVLNNLSVTFGPLDVGMKYEKQAFGMKMNDAYKIAKGVESSLNLISLSLPGNLIDDDIMKILMNGFSFNRSMIELNLSHNRIGNQGARRLAKFIMRNEVLLSLDLSDNQIGYDGSRFLAQALKMNKNLQRLSLKLNNIKDKGGSKFFKDLVENESLIELNMAANTLGPNTAEKIADYLADLKCKMQILDVSSNHMTDAAYNIIKAALTKNKSLREFNVKLNDMPTAHETELNEIVVKQHLDVKKIPFLSKTVFERKRADSSEEIATQGEEEGKNQADSPGSTKSPLGKTGSTKNMKDSKGGQRKETIK